MQGSIGDFEEVRHFAGQELAAFIVGGQRLKECQDVFRVYQLHNIVCAACAEQIIKLNAMLETYAKENKFIYVDYHSPMKDEINGLLTYDRKVCKVDAARMRDVAEKIKNGLLP